MDNIAVSICCAAYNHEKYIGRCLDGFLMQKTNFRFEVLVHDDASTDKTADIIRAYEKKSPDIIKAIYQSENQYSKGIKISNEYQYPRARGEFIANCEGDDYWIDEYKLQRQYDFMKKHQECVLCLHSVVGIDDATGNEIIVYPNIDIPQIISGNEYVKLRITNGYIFQTSSFFYRAFLMREYQAENPLFKRVAKVGDEPLLLWFASKGSLGFINCRMSCYRMCVNESWSSKKSQDPKRQAEHFINIYNMFSEYNNYTQQSYHEWIELGLRSLGKSLWSLCQYHHLRDDKYLNYFEYLTLRDKIDAILHNTKRKFLIFVKRVTK